jgi:60 kDa SS-A/Ro ribonucleoprotein
MTMANKTLFARLRGALLSQVDAVNSENAPAYALSPKQALAQYAVTGCFSRTFYAAAEEQLESVLKLCEAVEPEFTARLAVYSRTESFMKDTPALLCAWLSARRPDLHEKIFNRVVDNTRMLRTYVQILRSGAAGRKSLGTAPKRLVREWLDARSEDALFASSVGQDPSLADIIKMVHPKPANRTREAFYGYVLGRTQDSNVLPALVAKFEKFKSGESLEVPDVPFTMLSSLPLSSSDWVSIAENASWQTTRMNLNTFARHGVFQKRGMTEKIASRLSDPMEIARARVFPYQLLAAFINCDASVPAAVRESLQQAMELATSNIPAIEGGVVVCPDVSGSMSSPVTGHRKGATSSVRCIDVAALVAASILRKNPTARVIPFREFAVSIALNPRDSIMTNATELASIGGGGTNCSSALNVLNREGFHAALVVFVSDNESWVDPRHGRGTALMVEWSRFRQRNPNARLVCLDVHPNRTTQAAERVDVLNIGGFSDRVFEIISMFASGRLDSGHWTTRIETVEI